MSDGMVGFGGVLAAKPCAACGGDHRMIDCPRKFGDEISAAADKQLRFIGKHRERFVQAWIAETGLHPSECQLVETREDTPTGFRTVVSIEPRRR